MTTHHIDGKSFVLEACPGCGVEFLIPAELHDAAIRVRDRYPKSAPRKLFCPDGHQWQYTQPTEQQRDVQAQAELTRLAERVVELEEKLAAGERLIRELGGNVTPLPVKGVR